MWHIAIAYRRLIPVLASQGNKHFRDQSFVEAAKCYEKAIMTYGPRPVYMNNLAAACLKLER